MDIELKSRSLIAPGETRTTSFQIALTAIAYIGKWIYWAE